jgi:hypothetical protein
VPTRCHLDGPKNADKEITLTTKQAIEQVLKGKRNGMRVPQIIEAGVPLSNLKGQTPGQTFYSVLYGESKKADGLGGRAHRQAFLEPTSNPLTAPVGRATPPGRRRRPPPRPEA